MPSQEIYPFLAQRFARQARAYKNIQDIDLFGTVVLVNGGGFSNAGRPRLSLTPQTVYLDLGYPGVDYGDAAISIVYRGKFKSLTDEEQKNLKPRQAMEPIPPQGRPPVLTCASSSDLTRRFLWLWAENGFFRGDSVV